MPTPAAIAAANAANTDEVYLTLVTIRHADITPSIRVVRNTEDIVSRGETFLKSEFEVTFPESGAPGAPRARLRIQHDQTVIDALSALTSRPKVDLEVVLASQPDEVERGFYDMEFQTAAYSETHVEGGLGFEDVLNQPYPGQTYNPADYPGLF